MILIEEYTDEVQLNFVSICNSSYLYDVFCRHPCCAAQRTRHPHFNNEPALFASQIYPRADLFTL